MEFEELEYLELESCAEAPVIALANLLTKIYEESCTNDTDNKYLNQRATRFIFAILSKKEGLTQNDIVRISHLKGATISVTLTSLENEGLIKRVPDKFDHRSYRIYLTEEGRAFNDKRKALIQNVEQVGKKNTTAREQREAIYVLKTYIENLLEKNKKER